MSPDRPRRDAGPDGPAPGRGRRAVRRPGRALRIGLTGPIGCGKSTVAGWLAAASGVALIDADAVARDVLGPGEPAADAVARAFGPAVAGANGSLDRAALAEMAFADPEALATLEAIVHPAVLARILERLRRAEDDGSEVVVVEAIRLVEGGLAALCDEVWLITCSANAQRARLAARGMTAADAARRIRAQRGLVERVRPVATRVLRTDGTPEAAAAAASASLAAARRAPRR